MNIPALIGRLLTLGALSLAAAGCAGFSAPRYYLMSPVPPAAPASVEKSPAVGVGPLTLADYLERQNIVTRETSSRIQVSPDHKWAAALDKQIAELLATDLGQRLGHDALPVYPWPPGTRVKYQLTAEISRFIHYGDKVYLDASWRLLDGPSSVAASGSSRIEETADADYDAIVDAMSRAVARLADEIAAKVHQLK